MSEVRTFWLALADDMAKAAAPNDAAVRTKEQKYRSRCHELNKSDKMYSVAR
jgi:hypothetical protein